MLKRLRPRLTFANLASGAALFVALATGGAYAANEWNGSNIQDGTLTGADIQDLSLGLPDYGANSISTGKLKDQDVRTQDLRDLGVTNPKIAWDSVSSGKVINNSLTGDDIREDLLGTVPTANFANNGVRAFARVKPDCDATTGACSFDQASGVSSVIRTLTNRYCVTVRGVDARTRSAVVSVDWDRTAFPEGNAVAMTSEDSICGGDGTGFVVRTERHRSIGVRNLADTGPEYVADNATPSNDVAFTILVP
jgi:hypothetical protein